MVKNIKKIIFLIIVVSLTSCSTFYLNTKANEDVNPNLRGVPSSIMVYVFQLKDKLGFESATFAQIDSNDNLKGSVISKDTYVVQPGEEKEVKFTTDDDAKYIAIAAGYRNSNLEWKKIMPVETHYFPKEYKLSLTSYGLKIKE